MNPTPTTAQDTVTRFIHTYSHTLLRIAFTYVKSISDAEDIVQDVFLSALTHLPDFENAEHEKAWLIRCTINRCKNHLNSSRIKKTIPLSEDIAYLPQEESSVLLAVMQLPEKYRTPIHLHYYENYSIQEIADILNKNPATIGTWLFRGRNRLKKALEGGTSNENSISLRYE